MCLSLFSFSAFHDELCFDKMTESLACLHEFESQRPAKLDNMGIEIELPPTIEVVRQKRSATTTRSMKDRQRSNQHNTTGEMTDSNSLVLIGNVTAEEASPVSNVSDPVVTQRHRPILNSLDDNSPRIDRKHSTGKYPDQDNEVPPSPASPRSIDRVRTHHPSPSHPSRSSPSPPSTSDKTSEKTGAIGTVRFLGSVVHDDDTDLEETYF